MKLRIQRSDESDSIFVTVLQENAAGGFFGGNAVEVRPGQAFMSHPYRRLNRWCGKKMTIEREVADPFPVPVEQEERMVAQTRRFDSSGA